MSFTLPLLPYEPNALEPFVSQRTLGFHHGKHHNAYVSNLNGLIDKTPYVAMALEDIIRSAARAKEQALFNNAAQAWNHVFSGTA